jgi:hypothetical protein
VKTKIGFTPGISDHKYIMKQIVPNMPNSPPKSKNKFGNQWNRQWRIWFWPTNRQFAGGIKILEQYNLFPIYLNPTIEISLKRPTEQPSLQMRVSEKNPQTGMIVIVYVLFFYSPGDPESTGE